MKISQTGRRLTKDRTSSHPINLADTVKMWPTPRAKEGNAGKPGSQGSIHNAKRRYLDGVVQEMFPTPKASEAKGGYSSKSKTPSLGATATHNLWPTPSATPRGPHTGAIAGQVAPDGKSRVSAKGTKWGATLETAVIIQEGTQISGQLNPMWVEWLMGFPIGWTDLNS